MLELGLIRVDGGTQARVELNQQVVDDYAVAYAAGASMPPVIVFYDGSDRWLADGFHRYFGAKAAGLKQIYENVIPGTLRDAVLYSLKANATHGLRRTNADKHRAVETMLADSEWSEWSDRKIAEMCGVTHPFVASIRRPKVVTVTTPPPSGAQPAAPIMSPQRAPNAPPAPVAAATAPASRESKCPAQPPPPPSGTASAEHTPDESQVAALEAEVAALREQLTEANDDNASLAKLIESSDQLAAALADAKTARDLARALQQRINSMLTEIAELNRSVKYWQKKAGVTA